MEEITPETKNNPAQSYTLPYQQTGVMNLTSIPRERIEQGLGFCPLATQEVLDNFVKNYKPMVQRAIGVLHTNDRNNYQAFAQIV